VGGGGWGPPPPPPPPPTRRTASESSLAYLVTALSSLKVNNFPHNEKLKKDCMVS